jgi:hypothetical protein
LDHLNRATGGFEAAIQFMMAQDRTDMLAQFWKITTDLNWSRNEDLLTVVPELKQLSKYKPEGLRE